MISTRGRYALRIMADLAEHRNGKYIPMKEAASRQEISLKYLEQIIPVLVKAGFVEGVRGKGGGYRLTKAPSEYRLIDILKLTETDLAPVPCVGGSITCERAPYCRTLPVWEGYYKLTKEYFSGITLEDMLEEEPPGNYVI